jgi:hypothetical protein
MNDWMETSQEELDEFNNYYRYVESVISEKEGLIAGKFSECFEYSFVTKKGMSLNVVTYYRLKKNGHKMSKSEKEVEVLPFDRWKISERRNKLLEELGI